MKYLLDTHAAFWLAEGSKKMGAKALAALQRERQEDIAIAGISLFELARIDFEGKITLRPTPRVFLDELSSRFVVLPITVDVARDAACLAIHGDPIDRLIVATAREYTLTLVTKDNNIRDAGVVKTLW